MHMYMHTITVSDVQVHMYIDRCLYMYCMRTAILTLHINEI